MIRHLLRHGVERVLWVDPYPNRLPRPGDLLRAPAGAGAGAEQERAHGDVEVLRLPALPLEPLPGCGWLQRVAAWRGPLERLRDFARPGTRLLVGRPGGLAAYLAEARDWSGIAYDAMDDFPAFYGGLSRLHMARVERRVVRRAQRIFVSSTALWRRFAGLGCPVERVANAFDPEAIAPPPGAAGAAGRPRVIGYIGTLGRWFDWDRVRALAAACPEWELRLYGPVFVPPRRRLPANVRLEGPRPFAAVPELLRTFGLGLIPFRTGRLTAAVDPVKYYEYRAAGLPVLSTAFGEMEGRGRADGVFHLGGDPAAAVARARRWCPEPRVEAAWRRENAWPARLGPVAAWMESGP